jgi:hypothetical protein
VLVERHGDDAGTVLADEARLAQERGLAFLEADRVDDRELSIMIGTRAISGSVAMRFRNVVIADSESSIPSSMLTSMMLAPPRTWSSATPSALA